MARATPELVRVLRQRYENTDQVMTSIAAEFEIGVRTLQRMVTTEGWRKRSDRTRGLPIAVGLLEEAKSLAEEVKQEVTPTLALPLAGGGNSMAADRLEQLVVKQIEAEEVARGQLAGKRRVVGAAECSARTLATLTQTLQALQRLRAGALPEQEALYDDDMPLDIDEFRFDLARRIEAFVASRTDAADADGDSGLKPVDEAG